VDARHDEAWFRELFDLSYRDLVAYARRRAANAEDADDVVAEALAVAWRRRGDLPDTTADARLYLYGIARNLLSNQRRGARREARLLARFRGSAAAAPGSVEPAPSDSRIAEALAQLPERDRELLRLVAWDGLTVAEAAVVLDITTAGAESRLRRARQRLQRRLDDLGVERTTTGGGDR
jgi:RNA polymerase sigma-70 factor, ECF subfamily